MLVKFCLTYGDGLANVNIKIDITKIKISTVTVVQPTARFGTVELDENS